MTPPGKPGPRVDSSAGDPYLICISTLRLWRKCPAKARQSTGVSVAYIQPGRDTASFYLAPMTAFTSPTHHGLQLLPSQTFPSLVLPAHDR